MRHNRQVQFGNDDHGRRSVKFEDNLSVESSPGVAANFRRIPGISGVTAFNRGAGDAGEATRFGAAPWNSLEVDNADIQAASTASLVSAGDSPESLAESAGRLNDSTIYLAERNAMLDREIKAERRRILSTNGGALSSLRLSPIGDRRRQRRKTSRSAMAASSASASSASSSASPSDQVTIADILPDVASVLAAKASEKSTAYDEDDDDDEDDEKSRKPTTTIEDFMRKREDKRFDLNVFSGRRNDDYLNDEKEARNMYDTHLELLSRKNKKSISHAAQMERDAARAKHKSGKLQTKVEAENVRFTIEYPHPLGFRPKMRKQTNNRRSKTKDPLSDSFAAVDDSAQKLQQRLQHLSIRVKEEFSGVEAVETRDAASKSVTPS